MGLSVLQQVLGVDHEPRRVVHGVQKGGLHRVQFHGLDVVVDGGDLVVVRVVQSFGDTLVYQGIRREPGTLAAGNQMLESPTGFSS